MKRQAIRRTKRLKGILKGKKPKERSRWLLEARETKTYWMMRVPRRNPSRNRYLMIIRSGKIR